MKVKRLLLTVAGGAVLFPSAGQAQEALQSAVSADRALQYRPPASARADSAPHLGPVELSLGASLGATYTDNFRPGGVEDGQSDVIIRPQVDLGALYPLTETSSLTLGFGVGYDFYVDHSTHSGMTLAPNSALSYTARIKDLALSVYDQVDYSEETLTTPEVTGLARYPRLNNTAGVRASYTLEPFRATVGYAHNNFIAFDSDYDYLNRGSEQFLARVGYLLTERSQVGIEGTASLSAYDKPSNPVLARADFNSYSVGPYAELGITDYLSVMVRGGYTLYQFGANPPGNPNPSSPDLNSYYAQLSATHQITEFISHTLSLTRDVSAGLNSDTTERLAVAYNIRWQMTDNFDVGAGASYDLGNESATGSGAGGLAGEDYERPGFNLSAGYRWTEHLRTSLAYSFYSRNSSQAGRDYQNNLVSLVLSYRF